MPSTTGGGARRAFVAGTGFEPVASWLWARRGTKLLQPAVTCHSDAHCVPPERFELPIIGLKVRCVDRCATRGGVLSLRIELSFRLLIRQLRPPCRPKRKRVGHLGVEPSYTALSERPLRPDGPWPMNRGCCKPATASAAHRDPLATEPGALAGSPSMSTVPGIRTPTTRALNAVPLPLG